MFDSNINIDKYPNRYELADIELPIGGRIKVFSKKPLVNAELNYIQDYQTIYFDKSEVGQGPRWKHKYTLKELNEMHPEVKLSSHAMRSNIICALVYDDINCASEGCENEVMRFLIGKNMLAFEINISRPHDGLCIQCSTREFESSFGGGFEENEFDILDKDDLADDGKIQSHLLIHGLTRIDLRSGSFSGVGYGDSIRNLSVDEHYQYVEQLKKVQKTLMHLVGEHGGLSIKSKIYRVMLDELYDKIECHLLFINTLD